MSPEDLLEERLPAVMRETVDLFPGPPGDLAEHALARGIRKRRMRTVKVSAGTAAVALLAAGGAYAGTQAFHGMGTNIGVASGGMTTTPPAAKPKPPTAQQLIRDLESVLPPGGRVSGATGQGASRSGGGYASLRYTTSASVSGVDVSFTREPAGVPKSQWGYVACLPRDVRPYAQCTTRTLADGSVLLVSEDYEYPSRDTGQKWWYAALTHRDGSQVLIEEFGGGGEKETTSDVDPVIPSAQLGVMVQRPVWNSVLAALPSPPALDSPAPGNDPKSKNQNKNADRQLVNH